MGERDVTRLAHRMFCHGTQILGKWIEIHGGRIRFDIPHHENELAQSELATSNRFVKIVDACRYGDHKWRKDVKIAGNVITIRVMPYKIVVKFAKIIFNF